MVKKEWWATTRLHGVRSENGKRFIELCASNNMVITTTLFPHKDIHKHTWVLPDTCTKNQIIVCGKFRRSVLDTPDFRGANVNSDHHLVITKIKLRLCRVERNMTRLKKYNTAKLKLCEVAHSFKIKLQNRFSCLTGDEVNNSDDHVQDVENDWKKIMQTYQKTAEKVLGFQSRSNKQWISAESWKKMDDGRELKRKIDSTRSERVREQLRNAYSTKNKEVKKQLKKDKNDWAEVAKEAQKAAEQGHLKAVYDATRKLSAKKGKTTDMIKSKEGVLLTKQDEIQKRWKEHFLEVLNHPAPEDTGEFDNKDVISESEANIDIDVPTKAEIYAAIREIKNGTTGRVDRLTVEILKADLETSVDVLHYYLHKVREQEQIPEDLHWGLIVKLPKKGDLTKCSNWRGITLMVVAAKVLGRMIITQIRDGIDNKLHQEQAGFRKGRGTTEQIFILCNIIVSF